MKNNNKEVKLPQQEPGAPSSYGAGVESRTESFRPCASIPKQQEFGAFRCGVKDEELPEELYRVARRRGTERPYSGKYWDSHERGMYRCAICGNELFSSNTKFDSGTGWPSFTEPKNIANIELKKDSTQGMGRTEVLCKKCGAHLGHVFDDGPAEKGGKRYCINSVCLSLDKDKKSSKN